MRADFVRFSRHRQLSFLCRCSYLFFALLFVLSSCRQKPPRPEQAWPELEKLGQKLHEMRQQAGRFGEKKQDALSLYNYPDQALSENTIEKMLSRLHWLKPALISKKNRCYARLLQAQFEYEQQRQQDALRHYRPLAKWPETFNEPALKQRRYRRQLAALGFSVQDPKPLYHEALLALGTLERRGTSSAGAQAAQPIGTMMTRKKPLPAWQKHLFTSAQMQGFKLYLNLQNCKKNQCANFKKSAFLRAAIDVGIQVLALPRTRVVKMFHEYSALRDDEIDAAIDTIRRQPGQAMAIWMGLRAYEQAAKSWIHLHQSASVPDSFWIWLQEQGPMDIKAIKNLAQAGPQDHHANADQKPSPVPSGSDLN